MPKFNPLLPGFNAGELSPLLDGRVDIDKYSFGCSTLENYLVTMQGPLERRGGTMFIAPVSNHSKRVFLPKFVFDSNEAYVLEMGDLYMRFYTQRGQLQKDGFPYQISHPYSQSDLSLPTNGVFRPRYVQSGDQIFWAHGSHPPQLLSRNGATDWTFENLTVLGGPFKDKNITSATKVYASATAGAVTLTCNVAIFTPGMIGTRFHLENKDIAVKSWEVGVGVADGERRYSDGKVYQVVFADDEVETELDTGTLKPTHTEGTFSDGKVDWLYLHAGYGRVLIATVAGNGLSCTGTVTSTLPHEVVGSGNATWRWAKAAWNGDDGYPTQVAFFRERLVYARNRTLWFSAVGDYTNFSTDTAGEILSENAIIKSLSTGTPDGINWLFASDVLYIGTASGMKICKEMTETEVFSPTNATIVPYLGSTSCYIPPLETGTSRGVYIDKSRERLFDLSYDPQMRADENAGDLCRLSESILDGRVSQMAYSDSPQNVIWCLLETGQLAALSFDRTQQVYAWGRHGVGGSADKDTGMPAVIEAIQIIPQPDFARDDLWMVVRREVNGATRRYIEIMSAPYQRPSRRVGENRAQLLSRQRSLQQFGRYLDCSLMINRTFDGFLTLGTGANVVGSLIDATLTPGLAFEESHIGDLVTYTYQKRNGYTAVARARVESIGPQDIKAKLRVLTPWEFPTVVLPPKSWRLTTSTLTGMEHLAGEKVGMLLDGIVYPDVIVPASGVIQLSQPVGFGFVGLRYPSTMESMRIEGGRPDGTSQGKTKRIAVVSLRVLNSLGGKAGQALLSLDDIPKLNERDPSTAMGEPPQLYNGDVKVNVGGGYDTHGRVVFRTDEPLPNVLVCIMPEVWVTEG